MSGADSPATAETQVVGSLSEGDPFGEPKRSASSEPEQSGLAEYARILWRRKWIVLGTAVVAVVGVLGYCVAVGKTYTASATVYLEPPIASALTQANAPATASGASAVVNVADVIQIMESSSVKNIVARTVPNPPGDSVAQVGTLLTTDIVKVSASSSNPHTAAAAANAYAFGYISFERGLTKSTFRSAEAQIQNKIDTLQLAISNFTNQIRSTPTGVNVTADEVQLGDLENQLTNLENQLQQYQFYSSEGTNLEVGRVISTASVPSSPSSPHTLEYCILALIFGLIAGVGLALLVNAIKARKI